MTDSFNYLFLSDMHLSEGVNPETGKIQRNEDFFHDVSFAQLLNYHVGLSHNPQKAAFYKRPWKLIINGDAFDFLQVVSKPEMTIDGMATMHVISAAGRPSKKEKQLSENERRFGLGTSEPEVVWKLQRIAQGHPLFFQALGWFVAGGNELVLVKGNHDIELFWPAVQTCFCHMVANGYAAWRSQVAGDEDNFLTRYAELPESLTPETVITAVSFPENYYYEKDLFYVDHGCQCDPANAFSNFADPRLLSDKRYLELPSGSLFVRYFFNGIEHVHPFADNMIPITRYIFWLFRKAPGTVYLFLTQLLPGYLWASYKVHQKTRKAPKENLQQPETPFEQALFNIQKQIRQGMSAGGKQTTFLMIVSLVMVALAVVLAVTGLRLLLVRNYLWMALNVVGALSAYFLSSYLFQSVNRLMGRPYLLDAATRVCHVLNSTNSTPLAPVPYLIFGHDHDPTIAQIHLDRGTPRPHYPQWYINTGSWVPVFSDEERLIRKDEQLTFFRLVTDNLDPRKPPQLLQWVPGGERPLPVRVFE